MIQAIIDYHPSLPTVGLFLFLIVIVVMLMLDRIAELFRKDDK